MYLTLTTLTYMHGKFQLERSEGPEYRLTCDLNDKFTLIY